MNAYEINCGSHDMQMNYANDDLGMLMTRGSWCRWLMTDEKREKPRGKTRVTQHSHQLFGTHVPIPEQVEIEIEYNQQEQEEDTGL